MEFIDKTMLLWYIEIDFLCIEGVALKKNFIIILTLFFLALLSLYGMAHGGGTDENGGLYDSNTGEYHYHHGYPAHQHRNGECPYDYDNAIDYGDNEPSSDSIYIDLENLEDVLRSEFGDELAEEIRDTTACTPDTESITDGFDHYVEYYSLRDAVMRRFGEKITDRIFSNPNLIVFSPEDIEDRYDIEDDDDNDEDEEDDDDNDDEDDNDKTESPPDLGDIIFCLSVGVFGVLTILSFITELSVKKKK
jgi:hypothetical protein